MAHPTAHQVEDDAPRWKVFPIKLCHRRLCALVDMLNKPGIPVKYLIGLLIVSPKMLCQECNDVVIHWVVVARQAGRMKQAREQFGQPDNPGGSYAYPLIFPHAPMETLDDTVSIHQELKDSLINCW